MTVDKRQKEIENPNILKIFMLGMILLASSAFSPVVEISVIESYWQESFEYIMNKYCIVSFL